jgi:hypothetical protein
LDNLKDLEVLVVLDLQELGDQEEDLQVPVILVLVALDLLVHLQMVYPVVNYNKDLFFNNKYFIYDR